jgi:hypothetical protein
MRLYGNMVRKDGMQQMSAGPVVTSVSTAGNLTIGVAAIAGGVAMFTGAAGAVAYTTPTGTQLSAAFPDMNIGDSMMFRLVNTAAQAATVTAGTDVTASGIVVVNAAGKDFLLRKTAATTWDIVGIG